MPIGTLPTAALLTQAALGAGQMGMGYLERKKAESLTPPMEDAEQRLAYAALKRKSDAYETGAAFSGVAKNLRNLSRGAAKDAGRISGGAGGAAISAYTKSAKGIGELLTNLGLKSAGMGLQVGAQANQMLDAMAQRRLELQMLPRTEAMAKSTQNLQSGQQNFLAALTSAMGKDQDITEQIG